MRQIPRIVLISDTHGRHGSMPSIPDGDILIHAGDVTARGRFEELAEINDYFASLPHRYKILIAGNHDFCFQESKYRAKKLMPDVLYLQGEDVEVMGLKIYGSPWQPRFFDWAFNLDRGEALAKVWAKIPDNIDVLVTHCPPYGICDMDQAGRHLGCDELLKALSRVRPKLHVFGHIHEGYGTLTREGIIFVNASACNRDYELVNKPVVVDL